MWWQGPKPRVSNASFRDRVPVRPKPDPIIANAMACPTIRRRLARLELRLTTAAAGA